MKDTTYEVWIIGYDKEDNITDFDTIVQSFDNASQAVGFAKKLVDNRLEGIKIDIPDEVYYVEVVAERCKDFFGISTCVETLFSRFTWYNGKKEVSV